MSENYKFDPGFEVSRIGAHWKKWAVSAFGPKAADGVKWVVGISGGKDSTVVAALACRIFGNGNVVGVSMPCDGQKDMDDVDRVFELLGIRRMTVDVGDAARSILDGIENSSVNISEDTRINLPARLRMSTLYAVAQSVDGVVLCTANLTETRLGFATLYGDHAGSYSPLWDYTVTEVISIGKWLGLPADLVEKTPVDGLQPLPDEEKLGLKYADVDRFIRMDEGSPEFKAKVKDKYLRNVFKENIVDVPHPRNGLSDFVKLTGFNA